VQFLEVAVILLGLVSPHRSNVTARR
jgi:hypothetical protein